MPFEPATNGLPFFAPISVPSKSVNIIGGCCGTTPYYIKLIAEEASKFKPRNLN